MGSLNSDPQTTFYLKPDKRLFVQPGVRDCTFKRPGSETPQEVNWLEASELQACIKMYLFALATSMPDTKQGTAKPETQGLPV